MSYELEVNLPNVPKGVKVAIADLGAFENGKTTPVDDGNVALWQENNKRVELDDEGNEVLVKPTLGKANFQEGITVHVVKATPAKPKEDDKQEGGK